MGCHRIRQSVMSWPGVTPNMGYFVTDPCAGSSTTVSTVTITPTVGLCAGTGLTYSISFTLSGALGANETLELWVKIWKDAESEPSFSYDSVLGRFTTSPQTPQGNFEVPTSASDGTTSHTYRRVAEIRVVPLSSAAGSGVTCDSLASSQDNTVAKDCFA